MICCVIVLRLLGWIYERSGLASDTGDTATGKLRVHPLLLVALAGVEIALAVAFLRMLRVADHADHMHHGPVPHGSVTAAVACALVVGALAVAILRRRNWGITGAGLTVAAGAAALSQSAAMLSSHLVAMVVLESLTVVAPMCLIGIRWREGPADDVWVVGRAALAIATGVGVVAVILSVHADSMEHAIWLGAHWWSAAAAFSISVLFWASVLRFRLPRPFRLVVIAIVLEVGSLLALTMLVSNAPMESSSALGLGALADQRLAGGLMMLVDAALVASWLRAGGMMLRPRLATKASA